MSALLSGSVRFNRTDVDIAKIKEDLTIKWHDAISEKHQVVKVFKIDRSYIYTPRQWGVQYATAHNIHIEDKTSTGFPVKFPKAVTLRPRQIPFVEGLENFFSGGGLDCRAEAFTSFGKCHPAGTTVIMYDGSIKKVEDIQKGDQIMGPDSKPRNVLNTNKGHGGIYRVTPKKGESWECNDVHVLSLKCTSTIGKNAYTYEKGRVTNIPLNEYIGKGDCFKHMHKLWRTGVEFQHKDVEADPYMIGLYISDGNKKRSCKLHLGAKKQPAIEYLESIGAVRRKVWHDRNNCFELDIYRFKNTQKSLLTEDNQRKIPNDYLINSRKIRLQVLAGLLDGDGSLVCGTVFDIICKDEQLKDDILFLSRSLGMAAYASRCVKGIKSIGFVGKYWRVCISGHTDEIPTKVIHKKANPRKQRKNVLVTGFSIEYSRESDYYGFTLDGDHLYLLSDFTVTHNTVSSLEFIRRVGKTALIIVDQNSLATQWKKEAIEKFGVPEEKIGLIQGKVCDYKGKDIVIGMVQTLYNKELPQDVYTYFGIMVCDELHVIGAEKFSRVLTQFSARIRFGISATPDRTDSLQKVLEWSLGGLEVVTKNDHQISEVRYITYGGILSQFANQSAKSGRYLSELAGDDKRNTLLAYIIHTLYKEDRTILAVSDRTEHIYALKYMLMDRGVPESDIGVVTTYDQTWKYKKDPTPARKPIGLESGADYTPVAIQLNKSKILKPELERRKDNSKIVLSTYALFQKGVDVPHLDCGVDLTPRAKAKQLHGRILRVKEGKKTPIWVTILDYNSYRSCFQFIKRIEDYESGNVDFYKWDLSKNATEKIDYSVLKSKVYKQYKKTKAMISVLNRDGEHVLVERK